MNNILVSFNLNKYLLIPKGKAWTCRRRNQPLTRRVWSALSFRSSRTRARVTTRASSPSTNTTSSWTTRPTWESKTGSTRSERARAARLSTSCSSPTWPLTATQSKTPASRTSGGTTEPEAPAKGRSRLTSPLTSYSQTRSTSLCRWRTSKYW